MADLIAYQSGNWTGATTWKGVATGTGAKQATITNQTNTTTTDVASSNFTIGNGTVCEGLLLHCRRQNTTGTVTVGLYLGSTLQREVTVNASDLPSDQSWVFFKFATTLTAGNGSTYNVRVRGSSAGNATFWRDATAGNWARYIRNGTTATAAATDVTFICDELTGAGTKLDVEVTMDNNNSTQFGECNIGCGGILSWSLASGATRALNLTGNLNVWGQGTFNIGTSSNRPVSSGGLTFHGNLAAGLEARAGSTVNLYGPISNITPKLLTADAASGQAIVDLNNTTGLGQNMTVALSSTTRTATQLETATIATVNSATRITLNSNLVNTHHGVAPYQGELIALFKSISITGLNASGFSWINIADSANFVADNILFRFLGSASANRRGIDIATSSAGTCSITNCALTDFNTTGSIGFNITGSTGSPIIEDCVAYLPTTGAVLSVAATSGSPSIQRNVFISNGANATFSDLGGTIRDNRFGGCGVTFNEGNATIGTIKDNVQHSATTGLTLGSNNFNLGTYEGFTTWRNQTGLFVQGSGYTLLNCTSYHNASSNLQINAANGGGVVIRNTTFNGGSGASLAQTTDQLRLYGGWGVLFDTCTFGDVQTASNFINLFGLVTLQDTTFRKCTINDTVVITNQNQQISTDGYISAIKFDKFNNVSGSHRAYKRYGNTQSDQTTFRTAAPSEALLPNTSGQKLPSGSKKFAVASGTTATVTVYVNKSATYNGNQPRLIVKANSIAGIASDTVLATASGGTGSWLTLTGTTATVADNCVLEVYVDCDGTAGTVFVDDWSIT